MITVSNDFKNAMKQPIKELQAYLTGDNINIRNDDDLIQFKISGETGLCKTVMRKLEAKILGNHDLLGKWIHAGFGVRLPNNNFEFLDYGSFLVTEITTIKDTGVTTIVGYDAMINAMTKYTPLNVVYPIGLYDYTEELCNACGLTLANEFFYVHSNWPIYVDLWENIEGITYRDIFQQIAQVTCTTAIITNNDEIYFKPITDTGEELTYDNMMKLKLEPEYGEINSVVLSRTPQEDNVYMRDNASILANGLTEWKIENNEIIDKDREDAITQIYNAMHGTKYYPFETTTEGLGWYEIGDSFNIVNDSEEEFNTTLLNFSVTIDGGIKEVLKTNAETKTKTQYQYATAIEKNMKKTELVVDKQNQRIASIVSEVDEQNDKIAQIEITTDDIQMQVNNIYNTTKTVKANREVILPKCVKGYLLKLRIFGNNNVFSRLYPSDDLYPSNDLYPRGDSRIIVTDNDGNKMVYELRVSDVLRANTEVCDEYILENNYAKVIRRVNPDGTTKVQETEEIIGTYTIYIGQDTNTIKIQNYNAIIETMYVEQNAYTDQFATKIEMGSAITQTADEINTEVRKKVGEDEVISKINQSAEQVTIDADKININGTISANGNFKIDTQGKMECKNAKIEGKVEASEGTIGGFDILEHKIKNDTQTTGVELRDGTDGMFIIAWKKENGTWLMPFYVTSEGYLMADNASIKGRISGSTISGSTISGGKIILEAGTASNHNFQVGTYSWMRDGQIHMGENNSNGSFIDIMGGVIDEHITDPGIYVSREGTSSSINYWGISTNQVNCVDLYVSGSKNRVVKIDNGEYVLLNAYETATPYFGDIGSGTTDKNGICKIEIEDIFSQTIELENYKVFIQECGDGNLYVKKYDKYFEVRGTPNLEFDWEIKAIQKDYKNTRLNKFKKEGK